MSTGQTILCVDYNTAMLTELKMQLEAAGCTVVVAPTLRYAVAVIGCVMFDSVLLSHTLPDEDLREIRERLKEVRSTAQIVLFS